MGKYGRAHIGKTFNDGKLVVVDGGDKVDCVKVLCSVCAEDLELFGDGVFETYVAGLVRGRIPCGCSTRVRWTLAQYEILIRRKIKEENLPIMFIGFGVSTSYPVLTPVKLFCNKELVEYEVASISNFLIGRGNQGTTPTVEERINQYNLDNPNYTVWDSGEKSRRGVGNIVCGFHCRICEGKGLESVFEIISSNLFNGGLPCYCSRKREYSGDHVLESTKTKINIQDLAGILAIGAYKTRGAWYSVFLCNIHGVYSRGYKHLDNIGCHCHKCNPPLYGYDKTKQGSLYVLKIQTDSSIILGYGITNKLNNRLTTHRKNLNNLGYKILSTRVFEGSGTRVLAVENAIKALHKTGLIDCEGFRRESISIDRKEEVLKLCKQLKEITNEN